MSGNAQGCVGVVGSRWEWVGAQFSTTQKLKGSRQRKPEILNNRYFFTNCLNVN